MYGINSTAPIPSSINSSTGNSSSVSIGGVGTGTPLHVVAASGQLIPGATFMSDNNRVTPRSVVGMTQQVMQPSAVPGTEGSFASLQGPLPAQQQVQQLQLQQLQQQHMQHLHLQQLQQQQQAQHQMSPQLAMASQQQRLQQMSPHLQQQQQQQHQQLLHQQAHALGRTPMSPSLQSNQQTQQQQQHRMHLQQQIQMQMQQQQQAISNQSPQLGQSQPQLLPSQQQQIPLPTQAVPSTTGLPNASQPVPTFGQQEGPLTPLQMQFLQQRQIQMQQQQFEQQQQQQQLRQHIQQQHLQLHLNPRSPQMVQAAQQVQPLSMHPQTPQTPQQDMQQPGYISGAVAMPVQSLSSIQDLSLAEEWNARALLRLTEFGRELGVNTANTTIEFWQSFVAKFYGSTGRMRYKLFNPVTNDSKVFELVAAALPRLYLKNVEAGVKGMQVMLEQTLGQTGTLPLTVECPNVSMVSHYLNGSRVFAKGAIKATFASDFKFDLLELTSLEFVVYIPRPVDDPSLSPLLDVKSEGKKKGGSKKVAASPKKLTPSIPEIVVNEFGIASKTMQQLEVNVECDI
ncbi:hypothetical protein BGZ67_008172 [Mortierella alpina]|nr:hypothetical protein BGZ67_008172 [Mortierella alpina]